jgi:hypothetical protein
LRILFGHQSVGANLIDGLREQSADDTAPREIVESRGAPGHSRPVLCHFRVGRNHDAHGKLADFADVVSRAGAQFDLALFKFCYVDMADAAAVDALFAGYVRTFAELQKKLPSLKLGHVTIPLCAPPAPLARFANGVLLRRKHPEHARNAARERFNGRLRAQFCGEVFDLAEVESRGMRGAPRTWRQDGVSVPALAREFTEDGGHLNFAGRRAAAQAFNNYLASQA